MPSRRGLQITERGDLGEDPVPGGGGVFPDLGRPGSEYTRLQTENDPSSRPPFVAVMQSADLRQFHDRPQLRRLNRSGLRCIFFQRQVRARPVVISEIRFESAPQRRFIEHDEVVDTFPSEGSDQALHIGILPWRSRGRQDFANRHASDSSPKDVAVDAVAIMEQVAWGRVPREGLGNLLCRPFRGGMGGDVEMNHAAAMVGEHPEDKQDPKRHGWHYEEVGRSQLCDVVVEEGAPSLRGRLPCVHPVLGYRRLGKRDPELEQFAVDSRCSPKRIRQAHLADQVLNMLKNLGAPKPQASALPPPVEAKSHAMPMDHRFGFENGEGGAPARPEA